MSMSPQKPSLLEPVTSNEAVLEVQDLSVMLVAGNGSEIPVIEDVSFSLKAGEVMGLVGESGCGKSVTAQAIMGVLPNSMYVKSGRILLNGTDLVALTKRQLNAIRGKDIAMVFQDPMSSLNPLVPIGKQIAEALIVHRTCSRSEARQRALDLLKLVRIPSPEQRLSEYPHRLSGGMRQRVMIAMSLACEPKVIVADEPTTALDVTIQRQILDLLRDLQQRLGVGVIMITHDFGVIREFAENVTVMYAGRIVEQSRSVALFETPVHPYTCGLLAAMPTFDRSALSDRPRLVEIEGTVPALGKRPMGCNFEPRCCFATDACHGRNPNLAPIEDGHLVACVNRGT